MSPAEFGRAKKAKDVSMIHIQLDTTVLMTVLQHSQRESHATPSTIAPSFSPSAINECRTGHTRKGRTHDYDRRGSRRMLCRLLPGSAPRAVNSIAGQHLRYREAPGFFETVKCEENEVRGMRAYWCENRRISFTFFVYLILMLCIGC